MFAPHNEHWSTLPLTVYKVLFAIVGVRMYLPYMAVLLALHVVAAHLLWRIIVRAGAGAVMATAVSSLFLVLGAGAENISWAFQIGFVGALTAGLGMELAVLEQSPRRLTAAWLLGVVSVMCSGLGPFMVGVACLTVLWKFGWRRALVTAAVPAGVFVAWWLLYGRHTTSPPLPHGALSDVPDYVFTGITSAASAITGLRIVGALLLVPLAWWAALRAKRSSDQAACVALAAGTLLFFTVVGLGRIGLGVAEATSSRYVYITAVLLLPAAAVATAQVADRHVLAAAVVVLTVAWAAVHNLHALEVTVVAVTGPRQHAEARIIAAAQLVAGPTTTFDGQPESATSPDLTTADLRYLVQNHDLPDSSPLAPDAFDTVSVAANIQMTSSPDPLLPAGVSSVQSVGGAPLGVVSQGCVQAAGSVRLVFGTPASVAIHAAHGSPVTAHMFSTAWSPVASPAHVYAVEGAATMYLDVSLAGAAVVVDLPPAGATLCGVAT